MPKLTVTIIAQNEAAKIGEVLDAIRCADEILVVDGGSTDGTQEICRARGARVLERPFDGFAPQKRFAASQASHDWILNLDADEVMTPELDDEVRRLMAREEIPEAAFFVPMRLVFMGRAFRRGNQAHALKLRFFDRRRAEYADKKVHEHIIARGPVGKLREVALHYSYRDISHWVDKMNRYTSLGAEDLARRGARNSVTRLVVTGPFHFFQDWILQGNILEGLPGFCWSVLAGVARMVKYMKQLERRPG
jgi:glycosyltransferase involved in cell wall biosynthesis